MFCHAVWCALVAVSRYGDTILHAHVVDTRCSATNVLPSERLLSLIRLTPPLLLTGGFLTAAMVSPLFLFTVREEMYLLSGVGVTMAGVETVYW